MEQEFLIQTFETEKTFLRYGSFYPCRKQIKFILLGLFMFVYSWTEFLSMITVLFIENDNLTKLSETLLFCMTQAAFLFKLGNFLYHNKTMIRIETILKNPILNHLNQFEKKIVAKYMIRVKYLARLFRILCILTVSFYGLFPFIDEDPDHMLPLPGWFPFDVKTHQIELVIAQTCGIAIGAFLNSTLDILPTILITLGSAQFDILKTRLENITNLDTSVQKAIKKCVIYHSVLLTYITQIEILFHKGIFVQFAASVVVICLTGFQMLVFKDYDLRNTFDTERNLLTLSGFYPRRTQKHNFLYTTSALFNLLVSYGQLFSMVAQMVIDRNELSKFSETLLFFMTHFTFLCKLTNFVYNKRKMFEIEDNLAKGIFYGFEIDKIKPKIESCKFVAKIFRILCIWVILLYTMVPFLDDKEDLSLPLPGWVPYDTKKFYYPTAIFQIISVSVSAYNNSTIDILTCMLITVASAQFNLLKEALKRMDFRPEGHNTKKLIEAKFENCVNHHKEIVKFAYQIEDIFSKGIFLQFFASLIVICFTGFQMIVVPIPSVQFIFLIIYFSCMMCQVAMYCWYGHDIITTSDSIGQAFYMSNWYESDVKVRKNICIFLERAKKPVILTAWKFVTLSLTTFTTILRSSYSYFAVLQRLYKEDS
ncbi:odorant receptor Or1-like [Tribolium madens]|uniref:odorant receptor Or1-like n=1 Tax=Tribolium madens TaxID=41895 RepID=UPI001CF764BB|nr:odorant receptor Or1-like [Tribolium madens]